VRRALAALVALAAAGCHGAPPSPTGMGDYAKCDAGDEAWVKQTVQALLGRKPTGIEEARVLVDLVRATDRATVARGLTRLPEFADRWADHLLDSMRVAPTGADANPDCYDAAARPADSGDLARWLAAHAPTDALADGSPPPTMRDVLLSSLRADDLSPFLRAALFAMMTRPVTFCGNTPPLDMDIARRRGFGEKFMALYANRGLDCLTCHNSDYSVTQTADPATNRFWPIPGSFEKALFGASNGRPEMDVYSAFRFHDVVSKRSLVSADEASRPWWPDDAFPTVTPWGADPACGRFFASSNVIADPAGYEVWFGRKIGTRGSIWDIEASLHRGIDGLRADGSVADTVKLSHDPDRAFAYLAATRVASDTWEALFGSPLVIGHFFPRNQAQRDVLQALTARFVESGWSLRELLVRIVTDPLYNQRLPGDGCGGAAYPAPAIWNPFAFEDLDPAARGNSAGDVLHREPARALIEMAAQAAGWTALPRDATVVGDLGGYLGDDRPGSLAVDYQQIQLWRLMTHQCRLAPPGAPALLGGSGDGGADWIDQLVAAAAARPGTTLREVVVAEKDRLITEPDVAADEAPLVAAVFGAPSLDVTVDAVPGWADAARIFCGELLASPRFGLVGAAPPDQRTAPSLVVGATGYRDRCQALAPVVLDPAHWTVACGGGALTATPVAH